jgi:hypothetical protein
MLSKIGQTQKDKYHKFSLIRREKQKVNLKVELQLLGTEEVLWEEGGQNGRRVDGCNRDHCVHVGEYHSKSYLHVQFICFNIKHIFIKINTC